MISAQSRRQPSNGSNTFRVILLCCFALFFIACGGSKELVKNPRNGNTDPEVTKKRTKGEKVDTVYWTEVPSSEVAPIESTEEPASENLASYVMGIALPFKATSFAPGDADRFIQFYAGLQMACDDLIADGMKISLKTYDTEGDGDLLKRKLVNSGIDILIGPYERECLINAADWAKENKTPMVSPWVASNRITSENPWYIQLRPSVRDHYNAIVQDIASKFDPDQVIILKKDNGEDDAKVKYIQDYAQAVFDSEEKPFREFTVEADSLILGEFYMSDLFDQAKTTVFISQNYLFEEDEFVYNTLRKLSAAKGANPIRVYGMPLILDIEEVDYNLYKLLNICIARSRYVDPYDSKTKNFRNSFFSRYSSLPGDEAYFGYDVGYFFGTMLQKYGTGFQFFLDQEDQFRLLGTYLDIQKDYVGDRVSDDFRDINFFVNKYVDILRFEDKKFKTTARP